VLFHSRMQRVYVSERGGMVVYVVFL
jgi:hypothetical protein